MYNLEIVNYNIVLLVAANSPAFDLYPRFITILLLINYSRCKSIPHSFFLTRCISSNLNNTIRVRVRFCA